jgi:hypothetical protein
MCDQHFSGTKDGFADVGEYRRVVAGYEGLLDKVGDGCCLKVYSIVKAIFNSLVVHEVCAVVVAKLPFASRGAVFIDKL